MFPGNACLANTVRRVQAAVTSLYDDSRIWIGVSGCVVASCGPGPGGAAQIVGALAAGRALPTSQPGAPGPFAFADPAHAAFVLTAAGYTDITLQPMYFGPDAGTAYPFVLGLMAWMLDGTR